MNLLASSLKDKGAMGKRVFLFMAMNEMYPKQTPKVIT